MDHANNRPNREKADETKGADADRLYRGGSPEVMRLDGHLRRLATNML